MEEQEQIKEEVTEDNPLANTPDVTEDQVVNASFSYSIINGENDSPFLSVECETFNAEDLESLASLIAPMSHPQFFYLVVSKIQQDFMECGRELDLAYFMKKLEEKKEQFDSSMGEPYITPLELSRRTYNEQQ